MRQSLFNCLLTACALLFVAQEAHAQTAQSVQINVQVIAATTDNSGVDPRLEKLRNRLKEFKYSSYQIISEQLVSLSLNSHQTVQLPDKYVLEITPTRFEPSGMIRVHLHIHGEKQNKLVDTEYAIAPGGDLVVGGMKHSGGGALMVALQHRAAGKSSTFGGESLK